MTAEQLPAPVITDLDSDGINEIVLVTNDLKLSVLVLPDAESRDEEDQTLPHVDVKHKVVLPQVSQILVISFCKRLQILWSVHVELEYCLILFQHLPSR